MKLLNTLISSALGALLLAGNAAGQSAGDEFAIVLPSAGIDLRDAPSEAELLAPTRVVMLGTGTPIPDAFRAGPSIAVIHKGESYLFDAGAGAVRNAVVARYKYDIPSLYPSLICCVFFSHLHSDHTMDFSELALTMWWERNAGLRAWGPEGIGRIVNGMREVHLVDVDIRTESLQPLRNPDGFEVAARTIEPGILLEKDDLVIEAFTVDHGAIRPAFGFKVTTDDLSLVISGDTAYSETLLEKARGVDLLFHEVISEEGVLRLPPGFQRIQNNSHTTSRELARLADIARPGLLVLYHGLFFGVEEGSVLDEIRATYDGEVALADDLDVFP